MKIGIVGLDGFGRYVLAQLLTKTAYDLYVYGAPASRTELAQQAYRCRTAAEIFDCCDIVITIMHSVEELLSLYNTMAFLVRPGQIFLDMTLQGPAQANKNARAMRALGAYYFDCGIFSAPGAFDGKTRVTARAAAGQRPANAQTRFLMFVGGNSTVYGRISPLLRCISPNCTHMGPAGRGQAVRLFCGALAYNLDGQVCEIARLARRFGIPPEIMYEALREFPKVANPLGRLGGGKPSFEPEQLYAQAQLVEEMRRRSECAQTE